MSTYEILVYRLSHYLEHRQIADTIRKDLIKLENKRIDNTEGRRYIEFFDTYV